MTIFQSRSSHRRAASSISSGPVLHASERISFGRKNYAQTCGGTQPCSLSPRARRGHLTPHAMADIVTQLQDSVNEINGLFYNTAGVLQRDARPASTKDGELGDDLPEGGVDEKQIAEFATAVVASSRKIDALASALPEVELDTEAQLERIRALQRENDELEKELADELRRADAMLTKVTAAFEAATDAALVADDDPKKDAP